MGSLIPFQDLNVFPHPIISPKIEPKLEPFDEQQQPYFSNPNSNSLQESAPFPEINAEENDVYSEFFRISELFRSAFANKSHSYEDLEVLNPDSLSIIVPPVQDQTTSSSIVVKKLKNDRSAEMVRVSALGIEDQRYYRDFVRRTRLLYESLRIFSIQEQGSRIRFGTGRMRVRADLKAGSLMKDRGLWLNRDKRIIGSIPGIFIGDIFFFRMELCVLGLHGQGQAGIDYVPASRCVNGEPIATSIIVSGGYEDDEDAGDVIVYTGHGGQVRNSVRQCVHQKLEGGNLALERSMYYGIEIRVIRGLPHDGRPSTKVYVYDGLYRVVDSWFDIGKSGFGVYKYKLVRMADQLEMGTSAFKFAADLRSNPLSVRPFGYLSFDVSMGKENSKVSLFNDIDSDRDPMLFEYIVRPVYPPLMFPQMSNCTWCDCVSGCSDDCYCAKKNGGEFAYDRNGFLLRGRPLIFECGRFCRCPPSCRNRVSQKGLTHQLEVFRSRETGWGVRALNLIPAGTFICEYSGLVLTKQQAEVLTMNGDSLVYPNRFPERWVEYGDISQVFPEFLRPSHPSIPPLDFAMDVSRMRNVACYFSHSSSPNVFVQFVLYDHHNVSYPHLMLFAMENIPPLRELSLDYGMDDEGMGKLALCN